MQSTGQFLVNVAMAKRSRPQSGFYRYLNNLSSADNFKISTECVHGGAQLQVDPDSDELPPGVYHVERVIH